ncbi:hypothetical protein IWQ60_007344 [Tieghemiomyces parasiticus]|uniref:Uncharacterized protein n=1 Tax=Tieghemiomyces parasiticus TaxID=78921 RepID=A0A9W8DUC0_9FUNG|nr:hypothetical protein IWQ60_007344 [Tieghemiomyces parasiticus]
MLPPDVTIAADLYAKLVAMGGSLIPKQGILYGSLRPRPAREGGVGNDHQDTAPPAVHIVGLAPFAHTDHDLMTVLNTYVHHPVYRLVGWYSAPAVNVPTDNLDPQHVAACYFDTMEAHLLKIHAARAAHLRPKANEVAQRAETQMRSLVGLVIWLPCMSSGAASTPSVTTVASATHPAAAVAHHNSIDVYTFQTHADATSLLRKLRHPTCTVHAGPVESRILDTLRMRSVRLSSSNATTLEVLQSGSTRSLTGSPVGSPAPGFAQRAPFVDRAASPTPTGTSQPTSKAGSLTDLTAALKPAPTLSRTLIPCSLHVDSPAVTAYLPAAAAQPHDLASQPAGRVRDVMQILDASAQAQLTQDADAAVQRALDRYQQVENFFASSVPTRIDRYREAWQEHDALVEMLQFLDQPVETVLAQMEAAAVYTPAAASLPE